MSNSGNFRKSIKDYPERSSWINNHWLLLDNGAGFFNKFNLGKLAPIGGHSSIQVLGTILAGEWRGIPVADNWIASATKWNNKSDFSGNYNDLSNKPALKPVATSGVYSDLTGRPNLQPVATSGVYNDLTDKPDLKTMAFVNDAPSNGSTYGRRNNTWYKITVEGLQVNSDWNSESGASKILNKPDLKLVATSGSYNDLDDKPDLFNGDYESLSNKPNLFDGDYNSLNNKPSLFSGNYEDLNNKPNLFSGSYNDLSDKPDLFDGNYNSLSNIPTSFNPSSHNHTVSNISDFPTLGSLAYKNDVSNNGIKYARMNGEWVTIAEGGIPGTQTLSGTNIAINWNGNTTTVINLTDDTVISYGTKANYLMRLFVTGNHGFAIPAESVIISGEYDGSKTNMIDLIPQPNGTIWVTYN